MAVTVRFNMRGQQVLGRKLTALVNQLGGNRAALHQRFGIQALRWIDKNFQSEGGLLVEGPWAQLKASTIRGRRKGPRKITTAAQKRRFHTKILQDTGHLRQSFTMDVDATKVVVGTAVPYAIYHESDKPRKKLPRRRMLPTYNDLAPQLILTTQNWLREISGGGHAEGGEFGGGGPSFGEGGMT